MKPQDENEEVLSKLVAGRSAVKRAKGEGRSKYLRVFPASHVAKVRQKRIREILSLNKLERR